MSTEELLIRELGALALKTTQTHIAKRLLRALEPAPQVIFCNAASAARASKQEIKSNDARILQKSGRSEPQMYLEGEPNDESEHGRPAAHRAGVNAIAVDKFEGRYAPELFSVVSGGADGSIAMWDLEAVSSKGLESAQTSYTHETKRHHPISYAAKTSQTHTHGITGLSFYPFDSSAFLSSSYDHSLKVFDSNTLIASGTFQLNSVIYTHSISPIARHLLVACAVQHPAVRLVDLKSGAAAHTLAGHEGGAVLSVAWSSRDENILASGASDGTVNFWDIRRSAGVLGVLDMEDSLGIMGLNGRGFGARNRHCGKAHNGPVNGLVWTKDARHIVSCGHDERIRVWDAQTGANTLVNFGPSIRNRKLRSLMPVVVSDFSSSHGDDTLFYPNPQEILQFDLFEGKLHQRLRPNSVISHDVGDRSFVSALSWRMHSIELISAHGDGSIRSWQPRIHLELPADEQESIETENGERKRKRERFEEIEKDTTGPKITWK